jgi:hypothetical protein
VHVVGAVLSSVRQVSRFHGEQIRFANFELFIVDARGEHEPVRVTFTDGFDGLPTFSPDGKRLAWTSNRASDWQISNLSRGLESRRRGRGADATCRRHPAGERFGLGYIRAHESAAEIRADDLRTEVGYLASDSLEGRMTGNEGARLASEFIGAQFRAAGLQPLGDSNTFFQSFDFNAGCANRDQRESPRHSTQAAFAKL